MFIDIGAAISQALDIRPRQKTTGAVRDDIDLCDARVGLNHLIEPVTQIVDRIRKLPGPNANGHVLGIEARERYALGRERGISGKAFVGVTGMRKSNVAPKNVCPL